MNARRLKALASLLLALVLLAVVPLNAFAAKKTVNILKVSADYARLRTESGADSDVIATLRKDTRVFYLGRSGGMARVCTERGQTGYIYAGYLEAYGTVPLASVYYVKSSSLNVYKSASTSSKKLGAIPKNGFVLLRETNGNWGYVRSLSGKGGYVLLSGLKKAN